MVDIYDIQFNNIRTFLDKNDKNVPNDRTEAYNITFELMENAETNYNGVPDSIIEWIIAYNLHLRKIKIPRYTISQIENLSLNELDDLAKLLTMKGNNINNIINILKYLHNLDPNVSLFPEDIINEIIKNSDTETISKLSYVDKNLTKLTEDYKSKIFLNGLENELSHLNLKRGKNGNYLFKVGDRVYTDEKYSRNISHIKYSSNSYSFGKNYKISSINGTIGEIQHINTLGYPTEPISKRTIQKKKSDWFVKGTDIKVLPGIVLFDEGPLIRNLNSKYLKYKISKSYNNQPELNMMVLIEIGTNNMGTTTYIKEYAITNIDENFMTLIYVGDDLYYKFERILEAEKINNKWIIKNQPDYKIIKFGGYGESSYENPHPY